MQPGDVEQTFADVEDLFEYINFKPRTNLSDGINAFVKKFIELNKK